jgi:hypothetical protein
MMNNISQRLMMTEDYELWNANKFW